MGNTSSDAFQHTGEKDSSVQNIPRRGYNLPRETVFTASGNARVGATQNSSWKCRIEQIPHQETVQMLQHEMQSLNLFT